MWSGVSWVILSFHLASHIQLAVFGLLVGMAERLRSAGQSSGGAAWDSLVWTSYIVTQGSQRECSRGPRGSCKASYDLDSKSSNVTFTTFYQANKLLSPAQEQKEENQTQSHSGSSSRERVSPLMDQQVIQVGQCLRNVLASDGTDWRWT